MVRRLAAVVLLAGAALAADPTITLSGAKCRNCHTDETFEELVALFNDSIENKVRGEFLLAFAPSREDGAPVAQSQSLSGQTADMERQATAIVDSFTFERPYDLWMLLLKCE